MFQQTLTLPVLDTRAVRSNNPSIMKKTPNPVGKIIDARLSELNKSQKWLADQMGVNPVSVHKWIYGKDISITRTNLGAMSIILNLPIDKLMVAAEGELPISEKPPRLSLQWLPVDEVELLEDYRTSTEDGKQMVKAIAKGAPKKDSGDTMLGRYAA